MKRAVSLLFLSCAFIVQSQVQHLEGRLSVYPSGTSPENSFCGNIVVTKPAATGQYINLIRQGQHPWSIGMIYNTNNFAIGTGHNNDVNFNNPFFTINTLGNVGIGTVTPSERLTVSDHHHDTKIRLHSSGNSSDQPANLSLWASEPGLSYCGTGIGYNVNGSPAYGRIDNARGASYIRFLPGETKFMFQTTSGMDVTTLNIENGLSMGEMQNKLLQKIEELTLYMIQQQDKIEELNAKIKKLEQGK